MDDSEHGSHPSMKTACPGDRDADRRTEGLDPGDHFYRLFQRAPVGYLVLDAAGTVLEANETFCRLADRDFTDMRGKGIDELLAESSRGRLRTHYGSTFADPEIMCLRGEVLTPNGDRIPVHMETSLLESSAGEVRQGHGALLLVTVSDASRYRPPGRDDALPTRAADRTGSVLRDILETTLAGHWDWDIPAGEEYLSPTFKRMFGYEPDELPDVPETWQRLIFPEDLPGVLENLKKHVRSRGEEPFYNEVRYRHKDGSTVWVICAGRVVEWMENGEPKRMVGCHVDITGRKEAEVALYRNTRLLETIIDAIAAPVFYKNRDGVYLGCNNAFADALGLKRKDIIGKTAFQIAPLELARLYHDADVALLEDGAPQVYEAEVVHADGSRRQAMFHKAPFQDEDGTLAGIVGAMVDITRLKKAEAELRDSLEEKVALLREVHHRVKNNLQIVDSLLALQANRSRHPQVLDALHDSRNRVRSMALLHETLYHSGNLARINFTSYVDELCRRIVQSFGRVAERIEIETHVTRIGLSLEQAVPCGLIINELVSNALKHGFPDGRRGKVVVELVSGPGQTLLLSVSDDGVGLPADFDPENTSTLGLQLVFDLAGQLDGHLSMVRDERSGTAFRMVFPDRGSVLPGDAS